MIGLREYERDPRLPALAGEEALCLPSSAEAFDLVRRHLVTAAAPAIEAVELVYARWKPGTSSTGSYRVDFDGGERATVTLKTYLAGKDEELARRYEPNAPTRGANGHLRPFAYLPERRACMWRHPRELQSSRLCRL